MHVICWNLVPMSNKVLSSVRMDVGPVLTKFRIGQMAFGQPERTYLNIQNIALL